MSLCRDMMPPWEIKAEMDRLTTENERLGRDYQTARDAHDKLLLENDRLRAALHRISLGSQNSMTSKEALGKEARAALEGK